MKKKVSNTQKFNKIARDIRDVKIQGARNIAKAALRAYTMFPTKLSKRKLLSLRPTEPMLKHVLDLAEKGKPIKKIQEHFDKAQDKINKKVFKIIRDNDVIFTHCHSTNVIKALIYAKEKGKNFEIYHTETRPLYQGRKTARDLKKARIPATMFVDSGFAVALSKKQGTKKADKVFLGADAILRNGIINKIGSAAIARLAHDYKIPVYIIADSWKTTPRIPQLEQRTFKEVWANAPKGIKIRNPAFEFVEGKLIKKVVTEKVF